MYMNKLSVSRISNRRTRPHPFTPITKTPPVPGEHWTASISMSGVPDDNGDLGTIFLHDHASTYLVIQSTTAISPDALILSINRLFTHTHRPDCPSNTDLDIKSITLDQSWFATGTVSLTSPALLAHAETRGYTLKRRPDHDPAIAPVLFDIADAARCEGDLTVLHHITAAFGIREDYSPGASYDTLREARNRYNSNPFPTVNGTMSRYEIFHGDPMPTLASSCKKCGCNHRFRDPSNPWQHISNLLPYFPHLARLTSRLPGPF
jgi:hypothetical protein